MVPPRSKQQEDEEYVDTGPRKSTKRVARKHEAQTKQTRVKRSPRPWNNKGEMEDKRYTWKSKIYELKERIDVQRALFFEILNHKLDSIPENEMKYYMSFLKGIMDDVFLVTPVREFLTFFARYKEEDELVDSGTHESHSRSIPFTICNMLTTLPTAKGAREPLIFDTDKITGFFSNFPFVSPLRQAVMHACFQLNQLVTQLIDLSTVLVEIDFNTEPYCMSFHEGAFAARSYQVIDDYVAFEELSDSDKAQVFEKMTNPSEIRCEGDCCTSPAVLNHITWQFESPCPCASHNTACTPLCDHKQCANQLADCNGLKIGRDLALRDSWGIDCYTRTLIQRLLHNIGATDSLVEVFIQKCLLPAFSILPIEVAHDLRNALILLIARGISVPACTLILQAFLYVGPKHFQVHPKGKGVVCTRAEGIPANRIICRYLGEVYPPWAWYEKQDMLKQKLKEYNMDTLLPEFYNIIMERPATSKNGYDVLFVDPIFRGNFGSRLSHSCNPNCATTTITVNGRLSIVLVALRDIACGEELCFDYSCVSESKTEFELATCLCGCLSCRGSFVSYADGNSFMQVMTKRFPFVKRTAVLLDACLQPLSEADHVLLSQYGIKSSILQQCPLWLQKWIASILLYMQFEETSLPAELRDMKDTLGRPLYTSEKALQLEAHGVFMTRLQNVAISVDRVKHFLSRQPRALQNEPPFHVLNEQEVIDFLWHGPNSLMRRLLKAGLAETTDKESVALFHEFIEKLHRGPLPTDTEESIRKEIRTFRNSLLSLPSQQRCHQAAADLLTMYLHTSCFFVTTDYHSVKGNSIRLHCYDLPCSCATTYKLQGGKELSIDVNAESRVIDESTQRRTSSDPKKTLWVGSEAWDSPEEYHWRSLTEEERINEANRVLAQSQRNYPSGYVWGQLAMWYKQGGNDPSLSLTNDRKGCVLLPDIESCYENKRFDLNYTLEERGKWIARLEHSPTQPWLSTHWTFRRSAHVYGTPMLDAVRGHCEHLVNAIEELKQSNYKPYDVKEDEKKMSVSFLVKSTYPEWSLSVCCKIKYFSCE